MNKPALILAALIGTVFTDCYAQDEASPSVRQSAIFLEQIVGGWALVLRTWDRDPTQQDWQTARASCAVPISDFAPDPIENASIEPPSPGLLFGNLIYYRGPDGLQQYELSSNEARLFPQLRIGQTGSGSPAYQISGSGGQIVVTIGKIPSDKESEIVLVRGGELFMKCTKRS